MPMSVDHWKKHHGQPLGHDPPVEYHCPSCTKRRFYLQVLLRQNKAILSVTPPPITSRMVLKIYMDFLMQELIEVHR